MVPSPREPERHSHQSAEPLDKAPSAPGSMDSGGALWRRHAIVRVLLVDMVAGCAAGLLAYVLRFSRPTHVESRYLLGVVVAPAMFCAAVGLARGYESRFLGAGSEEFRLVVRAAVGVGLLAGLVSYGLRAELPRGYLLLVCSAFALLSIVGRSAHRRFLRAARRSGRCLHDVVLVGDDSLVVDLVHQVRREQDGGLRIVGACVPGARSAVAEALGVPVLGDLHSVPSVVRRFAVDTVAVTSCAEMRGAALRRLAWDLEGSGVDLVVAPGLVEVAGPRLHIRPMCGLPLLHVEDPELSGGRRLVKAAMDRGVALLLLVVLVPLLLGIAIAVKLTTPGPVLFAQTRVGRGGREFRMWKFRSMHVDAERRLRELERQNSHGDEVLFKIRDDPRVTPVGRWMRRFSLDELPQLINVLRGDMSLVGPRPPLAGEVARYARDVHRRLLVKPGLTGLWQINGRSDLSWDESIRLDLRYVENWSLSLDFVILCKTVAAVLGGHGAY
ncbi:MAG: sugar transferase [Mycobacteriales bacterium]